MKKSSICTIVIVLGFLALLSSCRQDPIFFNISNETAPKKPRIKGTPTNIVEFQRNGDPVLYVASGKLHWYAKTEDPNDPEKTITRWDLPQYHTSQLEGKIISLAVTQNHLFALCLSGRRMNTTLWYIEPYGNEWKSVESEATDYPVLQSIYADPDTTRLFAGARKNNRAAYAILHLDTTADIPTLRILKELEEREKIDPIFSGVIYREGRYFLSTRGDGIFRIDESDFSSELTVTQLQNETYENARLMFMGMIKLKDEDSTIIAIERSGGSLFKVDDDSFRQMIYTGEEKNGETIAAGRYATGALSVWEDYNDDNRKMLVIGIQSSLYTTTTSSYTNGYVEFDLNADNSFNTITIRRDSGKLQTIVNNDQYSASLGKRPINYLFQAPKIIDENMTFFASTQTDGLWSYRQRSNKWQWNAEE
jgi:hypothetical protein